MDSPDSMNPYASPLASDGPSLSDDGECIFREGNLVVVLRGATLPDWCVRCGKPAEGRRVKKHFSHRHPLSLAIAPLALAIVIGSNWRLPIVAGISSSLTIFAFLVIASAVTTRRTTLRVGLCPLHYRRRMFRSISGTLCAVLGACGIVASGSAAAKAGLYLIGPVLCIAGLALVFIAQRDVRSRKIDRRWVWLSGLPEAYLARLPERP